MSADTVQLTRAVKELSEQIRQHRKALDAFNENFVIWVRAQTNTVIQGSDEDYLPDHKKP